jgi:hypothetical protein
MRASVTSIDASKRGRGVNLGFHFSMFRSVNRFAATIAVSCSPQKAQHPSAFFATQATRTAVTSKIRATVPAPSFSRIRSLGYHECRGNRISQHGRDGIPRRSLFSCARCVTIGGNLDEKRRPPS